MLPRPPLSLALSSIASLTPDPSWGGGGTDVRGAMAWAAGLGFRGVQLDAGAAPPRGVRARDLDRSARRDLAAYLRRSQLVLSGLDLWIPPEHFVDPARSDRAIEAVLSAMELAAEVALLVTGSPRPVLSVTLPESLPEDARAVLLARGEATGTRLADHSVVDLPDSIDPGSPLAIGIDPAALLLAGRDPALAVSRAGLLLASARLTDATTTGRIALGAPGSRLDLLAYIVALSTAGYTDPLVLDLRGVPEQGREAERLSSKWRPGQEPTAR